ncbi:putative 4-hydroxy-4-methyl-2-oxoglutarate aldolase [Chlorella vulgaris]
MSALPPPRFSPDSILQAAKNNDVSALRKLIDMGVRVNYCNQIGQTALHVAALWGSVEAARELLHQGADVNGENSRGTTPLHFAAGAKSRVPEICRVLLDAGADTGLSDLQGRLPYENAESAEIRMLLDGPDPRIFSCAAAGDVAGLRKLFQEDPDHDTDVFDAQGRAPLHLAAAGGHLGAVNFLLQKGSFVDMQDWDGNSALHHAVREGHSALVTLLLRQKASLGARNFTKSEYASGSWSSAGRPLQPLHQTPLHLAAEAGDDDEMCEVLIAHGADVNAGSKDCASPLHQAANRGMLQLLRLLIARGADVNAADEQGWTPLMLSVRTGKLAAVEALLEAGADPLACSLTGATALHLAAVNGKTEVCKCLVRRAPAALQVLDGEGKTPAQVALGDEDLFKILSMDASRAGIADLSDLFATPIDDPGKVSSVKILQPGFKHYGGMRSFKGRVTTLVCEDCNPLVRKTLNEPGAGRVLVIQGHGSRRCALVGDRLTEHAYMQGWQGMVINGCVRDVKDIRNFLIGIMAVDAHPLKPGKKVIGERDVPVRIGGVTIRPGDWLYADEDGILVSSEELIIPADAPRTSIPLTIPEDNEVAAEGDAADGKWQMGGDADTDDCDVSPASVIGALRAPRVLSPVMSMADSAAAAIADVDRLQMSPFSSPIQPMCNKSDVRVRTVSFEDEQAQANGHAGLAAM